MAAPRRRRKASSGALGAAAKAATERRLALAITQAELADLAGVGLSSVRALEAGKTTMTLAVTLRILDALGLAAAVGPRSRLRAIPGVALLAESASDPEAPTKAQHRR